MVRYPPGWGPGSVPAGSWRPGGRFVKVRRPRTPPQRLYVTPRQAPIGANGTAQSVIAANGTATVRVGPSGVGTRWYPQQCTISTTSGATDTSTCTGYLGPVAVPSQIVFQSYAGGGDVQGLAVPMMQPGDLLTVIWAGGKTGDLATLTVIGDQSILSPG